MLTPRAFHPHSTHTPYMFHARSLHIPRVFLAWCSPPNPRTPHAYSIHLVYFLTCLFLAYSMRIPRALHTYSLHHISLAYSTHIHTNSVWIPSIFHAYSTYVPRMPPHPYMFHARSVHIPHRIPLICHAYYVACYAHSTHTSRRALCIFHTHATHLSHVPKLLLACSMHIPCTYPYSITVP